MSNEITIGDHYTEPDIKPSESPSQVAEDSETLEERADRIRAIMSLASSGFHVPFKTICEALGFDYDQIQEDLRVEDNNVFIRTKPGMVENKKPKKNTTSITEDMMNFLLK